MLERTGGSDPKSIGTQRIEKRLDQKVRVEYKSGPGWSKFMSKIRGREMWGQGWWREVWVSYLTELSEMALY